MITFIFLLSYFCAIGWWLMLISPEWTAYGAAGCFAIGYILDQLDLLKKSS